MEKVITIENLSKHYGRLVAVDNISFFVKKGEIFGLLGENGAGKTTTLEIIEGLRRPSGGQVKVLGNDITLNPAAAKRRIGVQLQSSAYYSYLTLWEILRLFGSFYKKDTNADKLLKMVNLADKANSYVSQLSGGQKQRFSIIASLVNDPEIVFLDEPTTGLDPIARRRLWSLIAEVKNSSKTIVLTTHYMEEAELLCDRVAIMEKGKIVALDETHKLVESAKNPYKISFVAFLDKSAREKIRKLGELEELGGKSAHFEIAFANQANMDKALDIIRGLNPEALTVSRASLEDVFVELTGHSIAEEEEEKEKDA